MKKVFLLLFLLIAINGFGQSLNTQHIYSVIDSIREANQIDGLQLAIVSSDSVLYQLNFGSVKNSQLPITDESMFCVSSISKSFTALGIMMLVEKGKLNLKDHLQDIAPEISFQNPWEETHPLQVVHLLEHSAGWSDVLFPQFLVDRNTLSVREQAIDFPYSRICSYPPGQIFSYQNTGPTVAGYLIEKAAGVPYEEFIKNEILLPLNMVNSTFNSTEPDLLDNLAIDLGNNSPYRLIVDKPAGGLFTNSMDMSKYLQMYLRKGKMDSTILITPESVQRMTAPASTSSGKTGYDLGYGLGFWSDDFKGVRIYGHSGDQPGFGSYMILIPGLDRGFFLACNAELSGLYPIILVVQNFIIDPDNSWKPAQGNSVKRDDIKGYYRSLNTPGNNSKFGYFLKHLTTISWINEDDGVFYYRTLTNPKKNLLYEDGANYVYYTDDEGYKEWFFVGKDWKGNSILQNGKSSGNLKKISAFSAWGSLAFSVLCIVIFITLPLVCLTRLGLKFFTRRTLYFQRSLQLACAALFSLMLSILPIGLSIPASNANPPEIWKLLDTLGTLTPTSVFVFVLNSLFGLLALSAIVFILIDLRKYRSRWLQAYTLALGISLVAICIYLFKFDMLFLRLWEY